MAMGGESLIVDMGAPEHWWTVLAQTPHVL
jgi:hypothetical protein